MIRRKNSHTLRALTIGLEVVNKNWTTNNTIFIGAISVVGERASGDIFYDDMTVSDSVLNPDYSQIIYIAEHSYDLTQREFDT